jgi:hypothetical protein
LVIMSRYNIRNIKLFKWFPKEDELAAYIARLCVLREDFCLELSCANEDSIPSMDGNSIEWRKIYSFRALCKTSKEIVSVVDRLSMNKEFKQFIKDSPDIKKPFEQLKKKCNEARVIIKNIRNTIGGHVDEKAMRETLQNIDMDRSGLLQIGDSFNTTHYKFCTELIVAVMFRDISSENQEAHAKEILDTLFAVVNALIDVADELIISYFNARKLFE